MKYFTLLVLLCCFSLNLQAQYLSVEDDEGFAREELNTANTTPCTRFEKRMIREINFVRMYPAVYAGYVKEYLNNLQIMKANKLISTAKADSIYIAAQSLLKTLETKAVSTLLFPEKSLFTQAKRLGEDVARTQRYLVKKQKLQSEGLDKIHAVDFSLSTGSVSVRQALIVMLINEDDPMHTDREKVLSPQWTHMGCYELKTAGLSKHTWVMVWGKADTTQIPRQKVEAALAENMEDVKLSDAWDLTGKEKVDEFYWTMANDEAAMLAEINRVRTNPKGYLLELKNYKKALKKDKKLSKTAIKAELKALGELMKDLAKMKPAPALKAERCVYESLKARATTMKEHKVTSPQAPDGSMPWTRVAQSCKNSTSDAAENLISSSADPMLALRTALIDANDPNRERRRAILYYGWTKAACYFAGTIAEQENYWIQVFVP